MGSYYWEDLTASGCDGTVYWDAPYGSTTAYMTWEIHTNNWGRTFNLYNRDTGARYNSGSTIPLGTYCMYIYKNGTYSRETEDFEITADAPPSYNHYYYDASGNDWDAYTNTAGSTFKPCSSKPSKSSSSSSSNFNITGNANGGYFGSTSTTATTLKATKSTTTSYTFSYWYESNGDSNYYVGTSYTVPSYTCYFYPRYTSSSSNTYSNNTLAGLTTPSRAKTTVATYTVTYNANGGSCSTASATAKKETTYSFKGWNTSASATTALANTTSYTAAQTVYAVWGSTTATASVTLPTPTRTGYTFKGWSTSSTASSGSTGSYTPTGNVTLYATWQANTYTISYNANGHGTAPAAQTKTHDVNLTLQPFIAQQTGTGYTVSFNKNGASGTALGNLTSSITYTQTNWNTNSAGTGTNYTSKGTYTTEAAATLYAIWSTTNGSVTLPAAMTKASTTENGFTITFNANGGSCSTTELTATNTRSYTFSKWAAGSTSGTKYSAGASFTPSANTTMYATWTESVTKGSVTLPTPTRAGHTFKGWATSSSATSGTAAGASYTPSAETTLYATWQINTWTVQYNANGYGTAPSSQTKTYGTALTLRPFISDQTTTGYTVSFNKNGGSTTPSAITSELTKKQTYWNTNSSGTGTNYSSSGTYSDNKAATLYAIWGTTVNGSITLPGAIARASDSVNYTISYNANGGTFTPSNQTITRITPYSFNKWAEGSVSGTKYEANATYTPTAAKTMYATWTTGATTGTVTLQSGITKNDTTATGYKVTFNANGGNCSTTSLNATDTTEWTFSKWNTKPDGTGTDYSPNTAYSFDANTPLYAKWISSTTKGSIDLPTPTRNGYTFQGWSINQNATSGIKEQYTPSDNVTLYAIWSMTNSIIHYNNNGTDTHCSVYYNNNGSAILCNVYYNNNGTAVRI